MKTSFIAVFSLFLTLVTHSQNEFAENWHFGQNVNLDFTSGSPVASSNSSILSYEGSVSVSDDSGNLLFYSNGGNLHNQNDGFVWNRNHQPMPNGQLLDTAGCYSSIQSSIVLPKVGSPNQFYMFTMDCLESQQSSLSHYKGLRSTVIDMSLDGGLGDVTAEKGIPVLNDPGLFLTEGISATSHANGTDYWLVVHSEGPSSVNRFYVYKISASGISNPIIQNLGTSSYSQMKFSTQGDRMVYGSNLFHFDNSTGTISNPIDLGISGAGKAFSNSGRYLYQSEGVSIYQYDLLAANIPASQVTVHTGNIFNIEIKVSMQLGPDCKIYVAEFDKNYVGVINSPDLAGTACNYVKNQISLPGGAVCQAGLPSFVDSHFQACGSSTIQESTTPQLNVFPNPLGDQLTIDIDASLLGKTFQITDLCGKINIQARLQALSTKCDVTSLPAGIYFVRVEGSEAPTKLIKK